MVSENDISENNPTPDRSGESNKQANPPEPQVPPAPTRSEPQPSKTHCEITCKTENNWWDKFKPFLEIAGVALLAVYTGYTIKMYDANKKAADAAKSAAETAHDALVDSQQTFRIEERPYISITQVTLSKIPICHVEGRLRICADVYFVNSGRTPAIAVNTIRFVEFGNALDQKVQKRKMPDYVTTGTIIGAAQTGWATGITVDPLDEQTAKTIVAGNIPVAVHGIIGYSDIFGDYHETGYCLEKVAADRAFNFCQNGNWFDKRPK